MISTSRARGIVKLAADHVQDNQIHSWLYMDEKGIWEKEAIKLYEQVEDRIPESGLLPREVDTEISVMLGLMALEVGVNKRYSFLEDDHE